MECGDIQEKLSAYIEGIVSSEEKGLIDEHLRTCGKCNGALADLKKTLEYVRDLEEVEPPPWLTGKVMARLRSEVVPKRGIFQRLFYPLHIKLPIEALATILVAVATIYVFKTIQPEMETAKAPPSQITSRVLVQEKEKKPALDEGKPLPAKPREEFMRAEERKISPGKPIRAPRAPAKLAKPDKVAPSAGAIGEREYKRKAPSPELRAALVERKREGVSLSIGVKDIETAERTIEKAFVQLGGNIIKKESVEQRRIIVAELEAKKVRDLFEKLKVLGEVKERKLILDAGEGDIEIRVEVSKIPQGP